jgi:hypothetical protein
MELTKEIIPESISSVPSHPALPASVDDLTYLSPSLFLHLEFFMSKVSSNP